MTKTKLTFIIPLLFLTINCKKTKEKEDTHTQTSTIKYAKGFDIIYKDKKKFLIIKKAFPKSNKQYKYELGLKTDLKNNIIKTPVSSIVLTSTTHIPMVELLKKEQSIIGFPNTRYVSSKKTRKLIDSKKIKDIGLEQNLNTEVLIELNPELIIGFALHQNSKIYNNIKKSGIPIIFNSDWLEETPLGRAEWIKFFGALFQKDKQADSIFNSIEKAYLKAKKIALNSKTTPKVFSGIMYNNSWNAPAGESFMGTFFTDANCDYIWKATKGTGSLHLNFENVLDKAHNANFWIGSGAFTTKKELSLNSHLYTKFSAFSENKIYGVGNKKGSTGGLIYFEESATHPDLVLKDIIKITHPELLPNYKLTYYEKLK